MSDKIVNHFVLADGSVAKYDANELAGDIAELADIRVGANGVTYANAGDAVRTYSDYSIKHANKLSEPYVVLLADTYDLPAHVGAIDATTGTVMNANTFYHTDYINIDGYTEIETLVPVFNSPSVGGCAFYDSEKTYISGVVGRRLQYAGSEYRQLEVPDDAVYIRICCRIGDADKFYIKAEKISDLIESERREMVNTVNLATDEYVKIIATKTDIDDYGFINSTTGAVTSSNTFYYSDYVNIESLGKIDVLMPVFGSPNVAGCAFYDTNKTYLSGVAGRNPGTGSEIKTLYIPENAVYIRVSVRVADVDKFVVKTTNIIKTKVTGSSNYGIEMFDKIGVISDSISVGWALDKNGRRSRRNLNISWPQQLAKKAGFTAYNLGASGASPVTWFDPDFDGAAYCYEQYLDTPACDVYIIGLGVNVGTIGSIDDINENDPDSNAATFYGQYARIIQTINADHPDSLVICLTEPTTSIQSYDQAVRDICELQFIDALLLDLERDYQDIFNTTQLNNEHQPDGVHFTPYGYSLLADATAYALNDFISKNPEPFKYIGVETV